MEGIPQIDISPFMSSNETRRKQVAKEWAAAFESGGFATIVGHTVPEGLIEDLHAEALRFFDLPEAEKQKSGPMGKATNGYMAVGGTALARTMGKTGERPPGDYNEKISFTYVDWERLGASNEFDRSIFQPNPWPARPARLQGLVEAYFDQVTALGRTLMRIGALARDLPEDHFAPFYKRMTTQLSFVHYPEQDPPPVEGQVRSGAHVDYLGFTILRQDSAKGGLQVQMPDGSWADVKPTPGSFIINSGELLKRWTNNRWKSNIHRVVNPPAGAGKASRRLSIVMFTGPSHDSTIECLPTCNAAGASAPIRAYDHFMEKINAAREVAVPTPVGAAQ